MRRRGTAGFSLIELTVTVAIFGLFLLILVSLEREFVRFDRAMRIEFLRHPEHEAVLARLRKDVLDSTGYPASYAVWTQSPSTLILASQGLGGLPETIVWSFADGTAVRMAFDAAGAGTEWRATGLPRYTIGSFEMPDDSTAVRVTADDDEGRRIVDQILNPRIHS